MAELLVKAKPHWKDNWLNEKVDSLTSPQKELYESRSQIGDIIVVRPDGWKWGKEECLPNFVVIKIPSLAYKDAIKYERPLTQNDKTLKRRKYKIPTVIIDNAVALSAPFVGVPNPQKDIFILGIIEKTK